MNTTPTITESLLAKPSPQQYEWQQMERSMFVHYGPAAWQGREYDNHTTPLSEMNPELLDTDQWCEAALSWGAKMIIFVAKHVGGFCWWQTDTTDYSVKNIPWKNGKGDVLADVSASCRKYGLKLGVYIYPGDDAWGAYMGGGGKTEDPLKQEAYNAVYRRQLTEVLSRYGDIFEVWFDGSCIIEVGDILKQYAPDAIVFQSPYANIRWAGTEEGRLPADAWSSVMSDVLRSGTATVVQGTPNGDVWAPVEVDTTLYDHFWFNSPEKMEKRKSLNWLMRIYYQSVGRGGMLLLNSSPDTTGRIPLADMERYREFGAEISRRFGNPIAEVQSQGMEISLTFPTHTRLNHAVLREDIREGERVRAFRLEAQTEEGWKLLEEGRHIGSQRICLFREVETACLRLTVEESVGTPLLSLTGHWVDADDLEELLSSQAAGTLSYDPVRECWITLEAGETAATWDAGDLTDGILDIVADLSAFIPQAGQYAVSILPAESRSVQVLSIVAVLEGVETPDQISVLEENSCYNLTRTAAIEEAGAQLTAVHIRLRMDEPGDGSIAIKPTLG